MLSVLSYSLSVATEPKRSPGRINPPPGFFCDLLPCVEVVKDNTRIINTRIFLFGKE